MRMASHADNAIRWFAAPVRLRAYSSSAVRRSPRLARSGDPSLYRQQETRSGPLIYRMLRSTSYAGPKARIMSRPAGFKSGLEAAFGGMKIEQAGRCPAPAKGKDPLETHSAPVGATLIKFQTGKPSLPVPAKRNQKVWEILKDPSQRGLKPSETPVRRGRPCGKQPPRRDKKREAALASLLVRLSP